LKKILFIINPSSGRKKNTQNDPLIKEATSQRSWDYTLYETTGDEDVKRIREIVRDYKPDRVAVLGGDGTINMVASLVSDMDIPMAILPGGSANGLAYNLNLPASLDKSLEIALEGKILEMDIISLDDGKICLHLFDAGLNARIVKRFENQGSKGIIGYGKQMIHELSSGRSSFHFTAEFGSTSLSKKAEMVMVANAKSFGTGAVINPKAELADGQFELIVIKPYNWMIVFDYIRLILTNNLEKMNYVRIYRTDKLKLSFKSPVDMQVDGEILTETNTLSFTIRKKALKVLVP
jgi:YegS/Rv2252/BmrU family lipid kinase